jgi:hypothetical protein
VEEEGVAVELLGVLVLEVEEGGLSSNQDEPLL